MEGKNSESQDKKKQETGKGKTDWNIRPYLAPALLTFIVFCLCATVFFLMYRFSSVRAGWDKVMGVLQPVIIGIMIAYLINPIMVFFERHMNRLLSKKMKNEKKQNKISRVVGTFGALIVFLLIIFILLEMLIPQLVKSITGFTATLPQQVDNFIQWFDSIISKDDKRAVMLEEAMRNGTEFVQNWFKSTVLPDIQKYITGLTSGIISLAKVLLNAVVGLAIAVYLLLDKERFIGQFKKILYAVFPARKANVLIDTMRKSHEIFGGFISGKILDSAIIGVLCYIGLTILQMPYTLLVSVIVGVTNVIPFFGPFIGAVPGAIIILLGSPIQGLYFILFVFLLQQLDGNVIGPKILGDSTGLSSFWVVFAILVGGGLFGFAGMLLGVPTFAVIYFIIGKVIGYILRKRKLPQDTATYIKADSVDTKTNEIIFKED